MCWGESPDLEAYENGIPRTGAIACLKYDVNGFEGSQHKALIRRTQGNGPPVFSLHNRRPGATLLAPITTRDRGRCEQHAQIYGEWAGATCSLHSGQGGPEVATFRLIGFHQIESEVFLAGRMYRWFTEDKGMNYVLRFFAPSDDKEDIIASYFIRKNGFHFLYMKINFYQDDPKPLLLRAVLFGAAYHICCEHYIYHEMHRVNPAED